MIVQELHIIIIIIIVVVFIIIIITTVQEPDIPVFVHQDSTRGHTAAAVAAF
jgi:hypothetical protein